MVESGLFWHKFMTPRVVKSNLLTKLHTLGIGFVKFVWIHAKKGHIVTVTSSLVTRTPPVGTVTAAPLVTNTAQAAADSESKLSPVDHRD